MLKHKITMILLKPFEKGRVMAYFYSGLRNQTPPTQGGPPSQILSCAHVREQRFMYHPYIMFWTAIILAPSSREISTLSFLNNL